MLRLYNTLRQKRMVSSGVPRSRAACRRTAWLVVLACLFGAHSLEGQPGPAPATGHEGHARMLEMLQRVRERGARENPYTGSDVNANQRVALERLADDAPSAERARLELAVGADELRLGRNEAAVEHLANAHRLARGADTEIAFQLAVAYLRLGESQNCIDHRDPASCLLPIRDGGVHREQSAARSAFRLFAEVLARRPHHLAARWLLNLSAMAFGEHPGAVPPAHAIPPDRFEAEGPFRRFRDVAAGKGLATVSLSGGVVADDLDGDEWLDIVVSDWSPSGQLRLFRNRQGRDFAERTAESGLSGLFGGLNLVQADYDNDGQLDLFVLRGAWLESVGRQYPNSLLRNLGDGRFRDVTFAAGLGDEHYPTQTAAWADYDGDGHLDLFVGNEDAPSQLFQNQGDGTFRDVAEAVGVTNADFAKAAVWGDYDADGRPDLYVSNFGGPNRLFRNNEDGTFTDMAFELGVDLPFRSFPAWFWDYDNDGSLDLFVSGYEWDVRDVAASYLGLPALETETDRLYRGDSRGGFLEVGESVGVARITQPMGSNFGDVDNDGFLDYYLGTGYPAYEGLMPNLLVSNEGGRRFVDVTAEAGVGHLQKGHGVAFADFDHDGDQDLFVELGGAYAGDVYANALFENPGTDNGWIAVRLVGTESNRSAIGARVRAEFTERGRKRSVYRWVSSGGSFGANPLRVHIGLGQSESVDALEVQWPTTGARQRFENILANTYVVIEEGDDDYRVVSYGE